MTEMTNNTPIMSMHIPSTEALNSNNKGSTEKQWFAANTRPIPAPIRLEPPPPSQASDSFRFDDDEHNTEDREETQTIQEVFVDTVENHLLRLQSQVVHELAELHAQQAAAEYRRMQLNGGYRDGECELDERAAETEERRLIALQKEDGSVSVQGYGKPENVAVEPEDV